MVYFDEFTLKSFGPMTAKEWNYLLYKHLNLLGV